MIDIGALTEAAGDRGAPVVFDATGRLWSGPPLASSGMATLLVRPVTDAVKEVDEGLVRSSLDREGLWWIEGFAVDLRVMRAVGPVVVSPGDLIHTVEQAGFDWVVVELTLS